MVTITKHTDKKAILTIEADQDVPNPCDDCDLEIYSFIDTNINYKNPSELFTNDKIHDPELRNKLSNGLAFMLSYRQNGGWSLRSKSRAGWMSWNRNDSDGIMIYEDTYKTYSYSQRCKLAENFLDAYNDWCNGVCFQFTLSDANDQLIYQCSGYIGINSVMEAIQSTIKQHVELLDIKSDDDVDVIGDAKWIINSNAIVI